jgi:hypothetical protein
VPREENLKPGGETELSVAESGTTPSAEGGEIDEFFDEEDN